MSLEAEFLEAFEVHSPEGIRDALAAGASATALIRGTTPIEIFIEGYLRSTEFGSCLKVLLDAGASIDDPWLRALLLDDAQALEKLLKLPGIDLNRKLHLPCAFTSCEGVTALHICAEFNFVKCAQVLIEAGADINAAADVDADGFGGQTPIFHAVNSIFNYCRPMMELLVGAGANLDVRLKGLRWGIGADWETLILDITPITYAQCGLYSQFHRREEDVYNNLSYLYRKRNGGTLPVRTTSRTNTSIRSGNWKSPTGEEHMKLRIGIVMIALVLAASGKTSTAQSTAQALQDAVTADSKHYSVEFENDIVRVLRVRLTAGDTAPRHSHTAYCAIELSDSSLKEGDGPTSESKAGQVFCGDALAHAPKNVGKAVAESIVVEFKNRQKAR